MSEELADAPASPQPRLLTRLRQAIRVRQYALRTEEVYVGWARRYIHFHGRRHHQDLGEPEVTAFLTHLASERNVSASTPSQARTALQLLHQKVLGIDLPWLDEGASPGRASAMQPGRAGAVVRPAPPHK
ncbi:site-specific integrase [Sphaerotilus mobilis]|uniref:Integrase-like protein n=1 Tax=Sphaerotilus mobilis TaxID=47994 RepID=A0A4Q7LUB9_9BURK|nr:site-specific integrase [Sphaerotilus mobilis]RZS58404.1 integrase-like protein [Sphaerotilus mobilis]